MQSSSCGHHHTKQNKESLKKRLESEGIQYLYSGKELGGFRKGGYLASVIQTLGSGDPVS
jgi:hypothetical protein